MSDPAVVEFLAGRHSTPSRLLGEPGPDAAQLEQLLTLASRVPDHGRLVPWRFLLISGAARAALNSALVARTRVLQPDASAAVLDKEGSRFSHAPVIVTVIGRLTPGHKVPEREQLLSAGAVAHQLLLAAQAMGFAAQWLTGWAAYDSEISRLLGLGAHESVVGFVHIGSCTAAVPERERPVLAELIQHWSPPA